MRKEGLFNHALYSLLTGQSKIQRLEDYQVSSKVLLLTIKGVAVATVL